MVIDYSIDTSMFSLDLLWLWKVGEVVIKGPLVTPGCWLFVCQVCMNVQSHWPWLVRNDIFEKIYIIRFTNICLIFYRCQDTCFRCYPHWLSFYIKIASRLVSSSEIKNRKWTFWVITKNRDTKRALILHHKCRICFAQ